MSGRDSGKDWRANSWQKTLSLKNRSRKNGSDLVGALFGPKFGTPKRNPRRRPVVRNTYPKPKKPKAWKADIWALKDQPTEFVWIQTQETKQIYLPRGYLSY